MNDDGNGNGYGGQNESEENGKVALIAAATAASFAAGAHGATRFVKGDSSSTDLTFSKTELERGQAR